MPDSQWLTWIWKTCFFCMTRIRVTMTNFFSNFMEYYLSYKSQVELEKCYFMEKYFRKIDAPDRCMRYIWEIIFVQDKIFCSQKKIQMTRLYFFSIGVRVIRLLHYFQIIHYFFSRGGTKYKMGQYQRQHWH